MSSLGNLLRSKIAGDILDQPFDLGRYATDASIYQVQPKAVAVPACPEDVDEILNLARQQGVAVLPRGGGTSQAGQTVNDAIVIDTSVHLNKLLAVDPASHTCRVQPGIVLDELNRQLAPHGLWFPVDISTSSRATIGGMTANNSCGARSLHYGIMRHNISGIDAIMADGAHLRFAGTAADQNVPGELEQALKRIGQREQLEIAAKMPDLLRRVGGYNLDVLVPGTDRPNLAELLVGSEGTLAYFSSIDLKLAPILGTRALGVCHFPTFAEAMAATEHLVALKPLGVELVDATMLDLARKIPLFEPIIAKFAVGRPAALLLVEFLAETADEQRERLQALETCMAELGHSDLQRTGGVLPVTDPSLQRSISEVRRAGLNIMMSMKSAGKPVSFVEDCAVALPHLPAYTAGLTEIFARHGTTGTWYAHASVGCLHVRPVLNLKQDVDRKALRAIAEEAFDLVQHYKGTHSGEHGDGIVRSEFHRKMFGDRLVSAFAEIKTLFDPHNLLNPNRIVDPPKMDDQNLLRYSPSYQAATQRTVLDWSGWPDAGNGFQAATEMCNNNGACRKLAGGMMCPSFRATRQERDSTRGRANVLRLALSGQLGADALARPEMAEAMRLCIGCKGCRQECPTGVDMSRMKIEVAAAQAAAKGLGLADRWIAELPDKIQLLRLIDPLLALRNSLPMLARLLERPTGISAYRSVPRVTRNSFVDLPYDPAASVLLFADTFNRHFSPQVLRAAIDVLQAAGHVVSGPVSTSSGPVCCGRTYLTMGLPDQAAQAARNLIQALKPAILAGQPIVGVEPSCLLTLRDEIPALVDDPLVDRLADLSVTFEEFIARDRARFGAVPWQVGASRILVHPHCHQRAFGLADQVTDLFTLLSGVSVDATRPGCCGMAGAFGYGAGTYEMSMKIGELSVLDDVRNHKPGSILVGAGFSCRQQIADATGESALHPAVVLASHLPAQRHQSS